MNRLQIIEETLREYQRVSIRELAHRFAVSDMTIRRDLDRLASRGLLVRTHGGGIATTQFHSTGHSSPSSFLTAQKSAIGKRAADLVQPGQTILIDAGSTTFEVVKNLHRDSSITIATVSMTAAQELHGCDSNLIFIGGVVRRDEPRVSGPLTEKWLSDFRVDTLFIGCDAAKSADGFYLADMESSSLIQAMIRIAEKIVVVTESSKFGRKAFIRYATPDQIHTLVTDTGLSSTDLQLLEEQNIHVILAEVD